MIHIASFACFFESLVPFTMFSKGVISSISNTGCFKRNAGIKKSLSLIHDLIGFKVIVSNIDRTKKFLSILSNIGVLLNGVLIQLDLIYNESQFFRNLVETLILKF